MVALLPGKDLSTDSETKNVKVDSETSLDALLEVAETGDPAALFELGNRHAYGKGHPVNIRNALDLWYGAAQQGHAEAIFSIGLCYFLGGGVAKDIGQAMHLWRQAAANGSAESMFMLGIAYRNGEEMPQDYPQACKWLLLALSCDHPKAMEALHEMKDNITPEDRAEGIRLMQEWTRNPDSRLG